MIRERRSVAALLCCVLVGSASPVAAQTESPGAIRGRVTADDGQALADVCVHAESGTGGWGWDHTGPDGTYWMTGLDPGTYVVVFSDCTYERRNYVTEWYDDKANEASADRVDVGSGATVEGIDAVLSPGGTISGRLTDDAGDPAPEVCVRAVEPRGGYFATGFSDFDGRYVIPGLRPGGYVVSFLECGDWPARYRGEIYDDVQTVEQATRIEVLGTEAVAGIDASLERLPVVDLALTALEVVNQHRTIGGAEIADGTQREIRITVDNPGRIAASVQLNVRVCPRSWGQCRSDRRTASLDPGRTVISHPFDGTGLVGDVNIWASFWVVPPAEIYEWNWSNNYASVGHYVVVGGTGFGVGA